MVKNKQKVKSKNNEKLKNPIDEYFAEQESSKEAMTSKEIFGATSENIDLKTDLGIQEILLINKALYNDHLLQKSGVGKVWTHFINKYMRLKVSLDRKSRQEFVNINKADNTDDILEGASHLSNIKNSKQ